jgi:acyl-CoA thioester hydrolase
MKIRIYYHHTDSGGVVYYGEYLKFLEEARTEYLEDKGLSIKELLKEGISFVVRYQEIEYIKPVFYGDILEIKAKVTDISEIKITFDYDIRNQNNQITTKAKTVLVCVDRNLKPKKLPSDLIKKLC